MNVPTDYRVPILGPEEYSRAYRAIPFDPDDPRAGDPLVRLDSIGISNQSYHARTDGNNPPYHRPVPGSQSVMWLRRALAMKLTHVNRRLRPHGHEIHVLDGYRPIACQRGLWDFYYEQARAATRSEDHGTLKAYAEQFAADPSNFSKDDPETWPSHTTGGAIDVTLRCLKTGLLADMGSHYEEITDASHCDHFERLLNAGAIGEHDQRLLNRRLMHWAMHEEGIYNHPFVFWHHDWGNQLHVRTCMDRMKDPPRAAWYGYIEPADHGAM